MNDYIFDKEMDRLTKWYRKKLDHDQLRMWFDVIGYIPDNPFRAIIDLCIVGEKFFPTPQALKDMYQYWLQSNPSQAYKAQKKYCAECNSTGRLNYWMRDDNGQWYDWSCGCSKCENWKFEFPVKPSTGYGRTMPPKLMTRSEISDMGGQFNNPITEENEDRAEGPESNKRMNYKAWLKLNPDRVFKPLIKNIEELGDKVFPDLSGELNPLMDYEEIDDESIPF